MDRGFPSADNISELFNNKITFLQALKNNSEWLFEVIDFSREERKSPLSIVQTGKNKKAFYGSTTERKWVQLKRVTKNGAIADHRVHICNKKMKNAFRPTMR